MTTLYIDRKGADVDVDGGAVVVRVDGQRRSAVPLKPLERVIVASSARLTTRFLARLAENGTGLLILAGLQHKPVATLMGRPDGDVALRMAQYALSADEAGRAHLSQRFVLGKLSAQLALLRRMEETRGRSLALNRGVEVLGAALDEVGKASAGRARLRGLEGAAAASYFTAYASLFPASLGFDRRTRRPPRDPVNACLSLGYTLLHFEAVRVAAAQGLDPMVGAYHDLAPGRESLACDFSEPLRPAVDRFVWTLFSGGVLRPENFSASESSGCRLKKEPRRAFYRAWELEARNHRPLLARLAEDFATAIRSRAEYAGARAIPAPSPGEEAGDG